MWTLSLFLLFTWKACILKSTIYICVTTTIFVKFEKTIKFIINLLQLNSIIPAFNGQKSPMVRHRYRKSIFMFSHSQRCRSTLVSIVIVWTVQHSVLALITALQVMYFSFSGIWIWITHMVRLFCKICFGVNSILC